MGSDDADIRKKSLPETGSRDSDGVDQSQPAGEVDPADLPYTDLEVPSEPALIPDGVLPLRRKYGNGKKERRQFSITKIALAVGLDIGEDYVQFNVDYPATSEADLTVEEIADLSLEDVTSHDSGEQSNQREPDQQTETADTTDPTSVPEGRSRRQHQPAGDAGKATPHRPAGNGAPPLIVTKVDDTEQSIIDQPLVRKVVQNSTVGTGSARLGVPLRLLTGSVYDLSLAPGGEEDPKDNPYLFLPLYAPEQNGMFALELLGLASRVFPPLEGTVPVMEDFLTSAVNDVWNALPNHQAEQLGLSGREVLQQRAVDFFETVTQSTSEPTLAALDMEFVGPSRLAYREGFYGIYAVDEGDMFDLLVDVYDVPPPIAVVVRSLLVMTADRLLRGKIAMEADEDLDPEEIALPEEHPLRTAGAALVVPMFDHSDAPVTTGNIPFEYHQAIEFVNQALQTARPEDASSESNPEAGTNQSGKAEVLNGYPTKDQYRQYRRSQDPSADELQMTLGDDSSWVSSIRALRTVLGDLPVSEEAKTQLTFAGAGATESDDEILSSEALTRGLVPPIERSVLQTGLYVNPQFDQELADAAVLVAGATADAYVNLNDRSLSTAQKAQDDATTSDERATFESITIEVEGDYNTPTSYERVRVEFIPKESFAEIVSTGLPDGEISRDVLESLGKLHTRQAEQFLRSANVSGNVVAFRRHCDALLVPILNDSKSDDPSVTYD